MNSLRNRPVMVILWLLAFGACLPYGIAEASLQCYDCHGTRNSHDIRPEDSPFRNPSSGGFPGNHRTHMDATAVAATCAKCHPGSASKTASHREGLIAVSSRVNNSLATTYYPSFSNNTSVFPQTATPIQGSCSNVNCHFEIATPVWGSAALAGNSSANCGICHGAPPFDGKHGGKHGQYFGTDPANCAKCHANHLAEQNAFSHATSAGTRSLVVRFTGGGTYSGDLSYPNYLPSQNPARNGACTNLYCHSSGRIDPDTGTWGAPLMVPTWSDTRTTTCYSCHRGTPADSTPANCAAVQGRWSSNGVCTPDLTMSSNGHHTLVGAQWIRKYPCYYCHNNTVATDNTLTNISSLRKHVNGTVDVAMPAQWDIVGQPRASFDSSTKVCNNSYCHSDGTVTPDPNDVRVVGWSEKTECNSCHGHPRGSCNAAGCHDGVTKDGNGNVMDVLTGWPAGSEWMGAMPMFPNEGPGTPRANSHSRHTQSNYSCDNCHVKTVAGACKDCHTDGIPAGSMSEAAHVDATYHVNKTKDVYFKDGGTYDPITKKCSNTTCHVGTEPVWGGTVNSGVICLSCHQATTATGGDVDSFGFVANGTSERTRINTDQWVVTGHGRYSSSGNYPVSGNPAANFPTTNPCWYCHDNSVLHNDPANPFRLRQHQQFNNRFDKECVYCHMQGLVGECLGCHYSGESLSPQLTADAVKAKHGGVVYTTGCRNGGCHDTDATIHNTGAGFWTATQKADVKNQYVMMGVCLQCHDDDSGGQCNGCHDYSQPKYQLGFDPGTGYIKPKKARASSAHFGSKHYGDFLMSGGWDANGNPVGTWRGGKFCWDCHDPHGDGNIYMIQDKVATTTDGKFGIPQTRASVVFTKKQSGADYANSDPLKPYNGICNVCHTATSRHYRSDSGDGHNSGRICTDCHQHRFADSHADAQPCNSCHANSKPVPKHTAFTLPQDCTKCHSGAINGRMDIMGQFNGSSHHVQGVAVTNKQCYACHWEATKDGIIDSRYHQGYDLKNYTSVQNAPVDLVIWKAGERPTFYSSTTAVQFLAKNIGTANERTEAAKVTNHCLGCHSDQNNDTDPFNDCKTPRQYAWDFQSIAARYRNLSTTTWGKVNSTLFTGANQKDQVTKAFSAHGNAVANQGGYGTTYGIDQNIPNTRNGSQNVQCY
ncbi:MAG: CxxxxCH/CxxCH domain-containing protein, partial [Geobacter sp.]